MLSLYTARCDYPVWVTETGVPGSIQPVIILLYDSCGWPNRRLLCVSALSFTMKVHVPLGHFPKPITLCLLILLKTSLLYTRCLRAVNVTCIKSKVGLLQTAHYWANAGVLFGARVGRRVAFETIKLIHAKVLCTIFDINCHPNIAHINMQWGICISPYVGPYSYGELNYCDRLHILINFIYIITPVLTSTHKPVLARAPSSLLKRYI